MDDHNLFKKKEILVAKRLFFQVKLHKNVRKWRDFYNPYCTGSGCLFDCHPESRIQGSKRHYDEDQGSGMETVRIRDGKKSDPEPGMKETGSYLLELRNHFFVFWGDFRKHIFSNLEFYIGILPESRDFFPSRSRIGTVSIPDPQKIYVF